MQEYVLGLVFDEDAIELVLVRKAKPDFQAGKLNGIGGKIEYGESPYQAMVREGVEEAGREFNWQYFTKLVFDSGAMYCYWAKARLDDLPFENDVGEPYEFYLAASICGTTPGTDRYGDPECMSNIPWLVAMAIESIHHGAVYEVSEVGG